jgi:nitroimidazol reductase NimA-like FMN-containing flavoprotein (pyridoxamine 5'-phosphate oxidase superfamily)
MSDRTVFHRHPERGSHDPATVAAILDAALTCNIGFVREGRPVVIPTIHARVDDVVYIHGGVAAGNLRELRQGIDVCLAVTLVDGIVAARSLFNHSMNYRSAVVFGTARLVTEPEEREVALRAITEHVLPGRWDDARHPSAAEDRQTMILAISIEEASAKTRIGPVVDDEEDMELDVWAGVIPLSLAAGDPEPDVHLDPAIPMPTYIKEYRP